MVLKLKHLHTIDTHAHTAFLQQTSIPIILHVHRSKWNILNDCVDRSVDHITIKICRPRPVCHYNFFKFNMIKSCDDKKVKRGRPSVHRSERRNISQLTFKWEKKYSYQKIFLFWRFKGRHKNCFLHTHTHTMFIKQFQLKVQSQKFNWNQIKIHK